MRQNLKELTKRTERLILDARYNNKTNLNLILPELREILREVFALLDKALPQEIEPD